jgi:hypothetical protein
MINWPAFLKYDNDDELLYLPDQSSWQQESAQIAFDPQSSDRLVDVTGQVFALRLKDNSVELQSLGENMSLEDVLGLIKAHEAQKGSCCVAKLYAPTLTDAFRMLAAIGD